MNSKRNEGRVTKSGYDGRAENERAGATKGVKTALQRVSLRTSITKTDL